MSLDDPTTTEEPPTSTQNAKNIKLNNFMRSPNNCGDKSPIHIRKVSPMMRKKPTIINGLSLEHSDEDSEKKKGGENPFDSNCNDQMRNLFFH